MQLKPKFSNVGISLGLPYNEDLTVRIRLKLNKDGSILSSEILDHVRMNRPGQGFYKVLAESALRAVRLCDPLKMPAQVIINGKICNLILTQKKC